MPKKKIAAGAEAFPAEVAVDLLNNFRRLNWDELVSRGDFVANESDGFELWEGPSGFRADAFVKPIYRRQSPRSVRAKSAA